MLARLSILMTIALARLPLRVLRGVGALWGYLLYVFVASRRRIVMINLGLCFPELAPSERRALARRVFVRFAQAWFDRGWLWAGSESLVRSRLKLTGHWALLQDKTPTVLFAPHFVGLDAGWTALTQQLAGPFTTIYTHQANPVFDAWILQGRQRFGVSQLFGRRTGVKTIVSALKRGEPLYLLPDMDFGRKESVFVPFFGVTAATITSLSRFARTASARVIPVICRMTDEGYSVDVLSPWAGFPSDDAQADTAQMNAYLAEYVRRMPEQYYWVHKRFKTRPEAEPPLY